MGYLKLWKQNLRALAILVVGVGALAGLVVAERGKGGRPGPGDTATNVRVVVQGKAPKGVAVTLGDSNGPSILARKHRLPFRTLVPTDGSAFYQVQAQLLGDGDITCTIAIGVVVETHHVFGGNGTCTAGVAENMRTPGWHTS